jgi:putative peptide zinc metalloprotease protein
MENAQSMALPGLRDDLVLAPGPAGRDGAPGWVLFDPIRNRYFALESAAVALLRHWHLGEESRIRAAAEASGRHRVTEGELGALVRFLSHNELLDGSDPRQREVLLRAGGERRRKPLSQRVQLLLFLRIPLLRPARFLAATWPLIAPLVSRTTMLIILAMGLVGLFLVGRDWDRFTADARALATPGGFVLFAITLAGIKILHEFGHAYAARRHGLRVSSMGVAILIFMPVLYTDVSDAWRLTSHRARLAIGAAGIGVELALACIATFLWAFLAPGMLRDVVFLVAGTTWILTLFVNLNPLMRFDGYYLLSDALRVPNLQSRAFALGRWRLREALFAFREPRPEILPPHLHRTLLAWCFGAWIWRFFIVVAIGTAVYFILPKVIALPLIAFEIVWLLMRPMNSEIKEWWERRRKIRLNGALIRTLAILGGTLVLLAMPWPLGVELSARLEATRATAIYPATPAQLDEIRVAEGERVAAGDALLTLTAPDLTHELSQTRLRIAIAQTTLMREAAMPDGAVRAGVSEERLASDLAAWRGLAERARRLQAVAPHDGIVRDVARGLSPGLWVAVENPLFRIVEGPARLTAYVEAADLGRIETGLRGRFLPDDPAARPREVEIVSIAVVAETELDIASFADIHGGPIAAGRDERGRLIPSRAIWRVELALVADEYNSEPPASAVPGKVRFSVPGEAPIARVFRNVAAIVIRESWF